MMILDLNKQRMYYSLQGEKVPVYEKDNDGNIIYHNGVPLDTGETILGYGAPVSFTACITNKLNEVIWRDYGIDMSSNYAQIIVSKNKLPLTNGSLIWKKSDVRYEDNEQTLIDAASADYIVVGVADEGLNEDLFLLKRNVK